MMTKSRWMCAGLVVALALTGSLAPATVWAQAPAAPAQAPGGPTPTTGLIADDPGRSRYISELPPTQTTEGHRTGAVWVNMLHVPGKAILCGAGTVLSTVVLLVTFGSGYELAVKTFEEGCHGTWVLKPEHLSGQIQRAPDL